MCFRPKGQTYNRAQIASHVITVKALLPDERRAPDFKQARSLEAWVPASRPGEAEASLRRSQIAGLGALIYSPLPQTNRR